MSGTRFSLFAFPRNLSHRTARHPEVSAKMDRTKISVRQ
jgi:hypothetical protein